MRHAIAIAVACGRMNHGGTRIQFAGRGRRAGANHRSTTNGRGRAIEQQARRGRHVGRREDALGGTGVRSFGVVWAIIFRA